MTASGIKTQGGEIHRGLLAGGAAVLVAGVIALILFSRTAPESALSDGFPGSSSPGASMEPAHTTGPGHTHGTENLGVGERYPELAKIGEWLAKFVNPQTIIYAGEPVSVAAAGATYRPFPEGSYEEVIDAIVAGGGDFVIVHEQVAGAETPELAPLTNDKGVAYYEPRLAPVKLLAGPARNSMIYRVIRPGGPDSVRTEKVIMAQSRFMEHSENHMVHGDLAMRRGKWKSAAYEFGYALKADEHNVIALNNRAWCMVKADLRLDLAEEHARLAVALVPNEPDFLDTLIEVLEAVGKTEEANTYRAKMQALKTEGGGMMNPAGFAKPDYSAHPMLDPHYFERDPISARVLARSYLAMSKSDEDHNFHLNRLLNPIERRQPLADNLETARRYLVDVNGYLREIIQLLETSVRKPLAMDAEVAARNEVQGLLDLAFRGDTPRLRFEAQRKLYLAKLFFDIDHDPGVQMGPVHKAYFDEVLDKALWSQANRVKTVDMFYQLAEDGVHINVNTKRTHRDQEKWSFHLAPIRRRGRRPIHVYHYACRFKREVATFQYRSGEEEYHVREKPIWETLHERRSGSILSKMIRKGIVHPRKIQDIIGAMFIVKDVREVEALQEALFGVFGGPLNWKDRVNTIRFPEDRSRLNVHSGRGYEVLKSDVDVLFGSSEYGRKPYIFSVEIQIYTVEGFLRTVHSRHYASHQNLKVRQFLEALLPYLFPMEVYGEDVIRRCLDSLTEVADLLQPVEK